MFLRQKRVTILNNYSLRKTLEDYLHNYFFLKNNSIRVKVKYRKCQFLPSGSSPGSLWLLSLHQGWISLPKRGLKLPKTCL